jgi:hypothetical protein
MAYFALAPYYPPRFKRKLSPADYRFGEAVDAYTFYYVVCQAPSPALVYELDQADYHFRTLTHARLVGLIQEPYH